MFFLQINAYKDKFNLKYPLFSEPRAAGHEPRPELEPEPEPDSDPDPDSGAHYEYDTEETLSGQRSQNQCELLSILFVCQWVSHPIE